jgi:4-aminobutyrate aminotransferase-like enzyme/Ser/Thr protein kinase RdoA (MazF antagonist)
MNKLKVEDRPRLPAATVSRAVQTLYGLDGMLQPLPAEWDQNFRLDAGDAGRFVVKIANRGIPAAILDFQNAAMTRIAEDGSTARCPRVVGNLSGASVSMVAAPDGGEFRLRLLTYLPGRPMAQLRPLDRASLDRLGNALGDVDRCLADFIHPAMDRELSWDLRRAAWISAHIGAIADPRNRAMVEQILLQYCGRVVPALDQLPMSVIHNDANDENVLLAAGPDGGQQVAGLLDFGDMVRSHTVNELAIACAYAILGAADPLAVIAALAAGYHRARPLRDDEMEVLFPLICTRLCVSVTTSAIAAREDPDNSHRQITDRDAWEMLARLFSNDWREAEIAVRTACGAGPGRAPAEAASPGRPVAGDLLAERRRRLGPSLSLAYDTPLEIARGRGQYLFDPAGRAYLDCVNNVCHVGHSHPAVVRAIARQASLLNTNTRYLHPLVVEYARRLTSTLPEPLEVCFFVNSGSEANELAVRLARSHTGHRDVVVLEDGYHGHTSTLIDLSPYKCEGPGGGGLAPWAHKVSSPDPYRGAHRGDGAGIAYADEVGALCERLRQENRPPALFLCEPLLGCGGQIVPPEGYLREAFARVHAAGGVCVADEVQVGMGRVGSHWWAFQAQDAVPDIVTIGKPIGNGHPLGAVVTTRAIAQSFANGMEFFSTFGGNPVSAAAGLAVLDVIEQEGLRERAGRVGGYLRQGFERLAARHAQIGDVRGLGMFIGVELVRDRETREPATPETRALVETLRNEGILLSAEGPHHNVLKIKPPLPFGETDADLLLAAVDRALGHHQTEIVP